MKWVGSLPRHSSTCGWPRGKYQMSPGSKSLVSVCPAGLITVVRTRPFKTNAHSAAVACQCNSRITPGSSCIDTPAIPFEIGSCSTVTSLPKLLPRTFPFDFSNSNLKIGNSFPDSSGKELPIFKFELEKSKGKVLGNSFGKEVTVEQLPISKGIAGVSMQLEPGVMRELHWHAKAGEWAFVLKGRTRTTVINPAGQTETNDFDPGDIWYFPRGHPHVLECRSEERRVGK